MRLVITFPAVCTLHRTLLILQVEKWLKKSKLEGTTSSNKKGEEIYFSQHRSVPSACILFSTLYIYLLFMTFFSNSTLFYYFRVLSCGVFTIGNIRIQTIPVIIECIHPREYLLVTLLIPSISYTQPKVVVRTLRKTQHPWQRIRHEKIITKP